MLPSHNLMCGVLYLLILKFWGVNGAYPNYPEVLPEFVPAMPGMTPDCVQDPRETFCINPTGYPKDRIIYLLENRMYNLDKALVDESRDLYTFETREVPSPPPVKKYSYTNPKPPPNYHPPALPSPQPPNTGYMFPNGAHSNGYYNSYAYQQPHSPHVQNNSRAYSGVPMKYHRPTYVPPTNSYHTAEGPYDRYQKTNNGYSNYWTVTPAKPEVWWKKQNTCSGACNVPAGSTAICQQQYIQKRLMALEGTGQRLGQETFWFPSCCICKIRN